MWCKADFFAYLLVFPHDPSEIFLICWFGAKETFAIINKVENCLNFFFHLFEIEIFVIVFTVPSSLF